MDANFSLHLWDCLILQAEIMLNILCRCCINPNLSSWVYIHGNYDFNQTHIALPSAHIVVHMKSNACDSWPHCGMEDQYLGPAWNAYLCYII